MSKMPCKLASVVLAFAMAGYSMFATNYVYAQSSVEANAYVKAERSGKEGQGVFLTTTKGCLLVTAAHVVSDADAVLWRTGDRHGRATVVQVFRTNGLDIAFLAPKDQTPASCPDIMKSNGPMMQSTEGDIVVVSPSGVPTRVPLAQIGFAPRLLFSPLAGQSIQEGFSGAGVHNGGVLIGIATAIDNLKSPPKLAVQRFDDATPELAAWLAPATPFSWPPFDLRQLPNDVRVVAKKARQEKLLADDAVASALEVVAEATEAAAEARRSHSKESSNQDYAVIRSPNGEYEYAGKISSLARELRPDGPGVLTYLKGDKKGAQIECNFDGLQSCGRFGKIKLTVASKYYEYWLGETCGTSWCRYGFFRGNSLNNDWFGNATNPTAVTMYAPHRGNDPPTKAESMQSQETIDGPMVTWDFKLGKLISIVQMDHNLERRSRTAEALTN